MVQEPERGSGAPRRIGRRKAISLMLGSAGAGLGVGWASGGLEYGAWWLTNTTPPGLRLVGPGGAVRGQVPVEAQIEPRGRARVVEAQIDGRSVAPADRLLVDTATLPDGDHELVVVAEDESWRRNRSRAALALRSDNTPPQVMVESRPERVAQGHTWLLRLSTNEPAAIQAWLADRPLDIQAAEGFGWAVAGFGPDAQPTTVPLVIEAADQVGNRINQQVPIQVVREEFPVDRVEVSADLLPLLGPDVRAEEDRRLSPTYANKSQPRLWSGRFAPPARGPIITEFGTLRSFNGGPLVGHHNGVDIAAPTGTPVLAPGRGRMVLVDEVRLRGRVAVLDHGLGVFTTYAHLSSVDSQVGQMIERGQPFAKVGSTGLSTGPHLHWELWIGGANVNPMEWTERDLP